MAILNFQKPDKVIMIDSTESHGKFEFRPLEPGYGLTIGNALRRVLLSSLEGYAFTSVKIEGVDHEFSTIEGVVEDVTKIILNIKQIRLKRQIDDVENEKINVIVGNQKVLKASDLQKFISGFQILNPDLVICSLEKNVKLSIELNIEKGRGYVPSEENKKQSEELNVLLKTFLDSDNYPYKSFKNVEEYWDWFYSFFDKIIQVPFSMPTGTYDIENFLVEKLNSLGIEILEDEIIGRYYFQKGQNIYAFKSDEVVTKSVEILSNDALYKSTLHIK